jgi:hypothetical protein
MINVFKYSVKDKSLVRIGKFDSLKVRDVKQSLSRSSYTELNPHMGDSHDNYGAEIQDLIYFNLILGELWNNYLDREHRVVIQLIPGEYDYCTRDHLDRVYYLEVGKGPFQRRMTDCMSLRIREIKGPAKGLHTSLETII